MYSDEKPDQRELDDGDFELVDGSATCADCSHYEVCALVNRFEQVVMQATNTESPEDVGPIHPHELAKICGKYAPPESGQTGPE